MVRVILGRPVMVFGKALPSSLRLRLNRPMKSPPFVWPVDHPRYAGRHFRFKAQGFRMDITGERHGPFRSFPIRRERPECRLPVPLSKDGDFLIKPVCELPARDKFHILPPQHRSEPAGTLHRTHRRVACGSPGADQGQEDTEPPPTSLPLDASLRHGVSCLA
jgi:hypothetical protein